MGQSIIRRPLIADDTIRSHVSPFGMCDGQSGIGSGFSPSISIYLVSVIPQCSLLISNLSTIDAVQS
jgi:hypothetical protein